MSGSNCPVQLLNQVKVKIPSVNFISVSYYIDNNFTKL